MYPNRHGVNDPISKESGILDLLHEIVDILQTSTIAEERGKDLRSKFWASYKKVSVESDDNMLERCNGNMDIILIFAGLFSAANTAFIIAMQPNPANTTNVLLVQLIQITLYGPSAAQPTMISPSTNYSSNFWIQALAYMSLALSLLAAFCAVLGKQWLKYYKTHRYGNGSLEQRCMQRQGKLQGLETWHFEGVLQSFADLLKLSLFLFGLSLGPWMWTQQRTISILICSVTTFGFVCYLATIGASLIDPNCPFQTRFSSAIHTNPQSKVSIANAMEWMLRTSTNPDVVKAALEVMSSMSETLRNVNLTRLCEEVRIMFEACFDTEGKLIFEDDALAFGKALIQLTRNDSDDSDALPPSTQKWNFWPSWRTSRNDSDALPPSTQKRNFWPSWRTSRNDSDALPPSTQKFWPSWRTLYLPRALEQCQISYDRLAKAQDTTLRLRYQADMRTALRMAVPAGMDEFVSPDDTRLIWGGNFELELDLAKVNWLTACTKQFFQKDVQAAGDALLLLSGIPKSSLFLSQDDITQYLKVAHDQIDHKSHTRWRHIVLRAAYQALDNDHKLSCHTYFSEAVLKTVCLAVDHTKMFSEAIKLINSTEWPKGGHLESSPLDKIQILVLRVLPAPGVNDTGTYLDYCHALKYHIDKSQLQLRNTALRVACDLGKDLATVTADEVDERIRDMVLSQLFPFPTTVVSSGTPTSDGAFYYLRLVFSLANRSSWRRHLNEDNHVKRFIGIIPDFCTEPPPYIFYLAALFLRIQVAHPRQADPQLCSITGEQWWDLMRMAWCIASRSCDQPHGDDDVLDDDIEILRALVTGTRMHMPRGIPVIVDHLEVLRGWLSSTFKRLESRGPQLDESILLEVKGLKDLVHYSILEAKSTYSGTDQKALA